MVAKKKLDKEVRKNLIKARKMMQDVAKIDGNEAETRKRVDRMFEFIMGYDVFKHVTREHAVKGAGETEHCDFAIQIDNGETDKPVIIVELKRVNIDLGLKHLKQVSSYAINMGCEWVLLTNGKHWKLYHITFGKPPRTKLVDEWDLLNDDLIVLADKFNMISYKSVKKGILDKLWETRSILTPRNMLEIILSEDSIRMIRKELKKKTKVNVSPEEIVGVIRHLLNEVSANEMENIKISLPGKKERKKKNIKQEEVEDIKDLTNLEPLTIEKDKETCFSE